jgi:hypothetical protein
MLRTNLIGVADTTLGRYFARAEVKKQLGRAGRQLRAEEHALAARRSAERRLEQTVRPSSHRADRGRTRTRLRQKSVSSFRQNATAAFCLRPTL